MKRLANYTLKMLDLECRFRHSKRHETVDLRPQAQANQNGLFAPPAIGSPDPEIRITLGKQDGLWGGIVSQGNTRVELPSGSLVDVLLAAKELVIGPLPIILAHAAHRGALRYRDVRLCVAPETSLEAEELLCLIDAKSGGHGLDLTQCELRNIDLGHEWIEQRWQADPDAKSNVDPRWKSHDTGGINLSGVCLRDAFLTDTNLTRADLNAADLQGARLSSVKLHRAEMKNADVSNASLFRANFYRAEMLGVNLSGAKVMDSEFVEARLSLTDWRGAVVLNSLLSSASLRTAHLEGVDFYTMKPGAFENVHWLNAYLDRTLLRRDQLGKVLREDAEARSGRRLIHEPSEEGYESFDLPADFREDAFRQAREVYLLHKNNFTSIGRYADASWAYQKEREMERARLFRAWQHGSPRAWRDFGAWMLSWVECSITGYGERPWRTTIAATLTIVIFAAIYDLSNAFVPEGGTPATDIRFWDALILSGATFFSASMSTLNPLYYWGQVLVVVESAVGIGLIALLIFTLGNRISRS